VTQPIQPLRRRVGRTVLFAVWLVVILWMTPDLARAQSPETVVPGGEQPQPQPQVAPPPRTNPFGSFVRGITAFGTGDAYLMANANRPPGGDNLLRNFDTRSGEVRLNYVEMAFERKTSDRVALGFRADLGAGPTAKLVAAPEPGPSGLKYVQQAYLSVRAPIGSGLTVDAGKFVTPAGAEVIETQDNWNYSRSLLFAWAIPYYHAGVRASYAFNDKLTSTGFVLNGWNNVKDNTARSRSRRKWWSRPPTGSASPPPGWAALRAQLTPAWTLSPRVEWFSDPQGASTGVAQDVVEGAITVQRTIAAGLSARAEYRVDRSTMAFFPNEDGTARRGQQPVGVGLFYGWSSR